jgi:hypothetical protein
VQSAGSILKAARRFRSQRFFNPALLGAAIYELHRNQLPRRYRSCISSPIAMTIGYRQSQTDIWREARAAGQLANMVTLLELNVTQFRQLTEANASK